MHVLSYCLTNGIKQRGLSVDPKWRVWHEYVTWCQNSGISSATEQGQTHQDGRRIRQFVQLAKNELGRCGRE